MSAASNTLSQASVPRWKSLSRWQAFSIHFALSVMIFLTLVAIMVFFWFPGELFLIDGGLQGLKLVAIIDLILGPALTLVLWNTKKPELLFDVSVVAMFQIAALAYGFVTTYDQRTVAMVFAERTFVSLSNADLQKSSEILIEKEITPVPLSKFKAGRPVVVMAPPLDKDTFGQYLEDVMNGYPEAFQRNDQYMDLADGRDGMKKGALDKQDLEQLGWYEQVQQEVQAKGFDKETLEFYKFKTRYASGVAMFDTAALQIVDYLPLKPVQTQTAETQVDE